MKAARKSCSVKRAHIREQIADLAQVIHQYASASESSQPRGFELWSRANRIENKASRMARKISELFANIGADEILQEQQEAGSVTISPESCILSREDDECDTNSN